MVGFSLLEFISFNKYKPTVILWIGIIGILFHLILHWSSPSVLVVMQINNIVVAMACILSLFCIAFMLSRKPTKAQWFFILMVSMSALWWITCLVPVLLGYGQHTIADISNNAYSGVQGIDGIASTLFVLYPLEVLRPNFLKLRTTLKIFIPALIVVLLVALSNSIEGEGQEFNIKLILISRIVLVLGYPLVTLLYLLRYQKTYKEWCKQNYSNIEKLDASWLKYYVVGYLFIYTSYLYTVLNLNHETVLVHHVMFLLFYTLIFPFVFSQQELVLGPEDDEDTLSLTANDYSDEQNVKERQTYNNSSLMYKEKLIHWMEHDKPYLNMDFRLIDIMDILPLNRKYISRLINEEIGEPFYSFVMKYRINESLRLLENRHDLTIAKIAIKSGFSSPSVFGRSFLKEIGMSPLEYRKQHKH